MQNKINILDFTSIQSLFDKLNKQLEKAQKVTESTETPRLYVKLLVHLTVSCSTHCAFSAQLSLREYMSAEIIVDCKQQMIVLLLDVMLEYACLFWNHLRIASQQQDRNIAPITGFLEDVRVTGGFVGLNTAFPECHIKNTFSFLPNWCQVIKFSLFSEQQGYAKNLFPVGLCTKHLG